MLDKTIPQWVAVKTMSRHEKVVYNSLQSKGYEVYLPTRKELHKWKDRKKWVAVPLISTYVFCKIVKEDLFWINSEKSVSRVITFGDDVAIVSEKEIEYMKLLVSSEYELFIKSISELKKGKKVRVLAGSCEGMEGYIIKSSKDGNFAVQIDSISMMVQATVEKEYLQIIE